MMRETFRKLSPRKQEKILAAAARVFARDGADRASVSEICKQAGISNGALYKYVTNKEALFFSVIDHGANLMVHELFNRPAEATSFFEALEKLFRGFEQFLKRHRPFIELYSELTASSRNKFSVYVAEKVQNEGRHLFLHLVEEGKRRGEIRPDIRSDLIAFFLDSQLELYTYSLVSEYHGRRFNAFFRTGVRKLTEAEKVAVVVQSAKAFLQNAGAKAPLPIRTIQEGERA